MIEVTIAFFAGVLIILGLPDEEPLSPGMKRFCLVLGFLASTLAAWMVLQG